MKINKKTLGSSLALGAGLLFFQGHAAAASDQLQLAGTDKKVHCHGINKCAGKSECGVKGAHGCQGQNECKGKGFISLPKKACKAQGGSEEPVSEAS